MAPPQLRQHGLRRIPFKLYRSFLTWKQPTQYRTAHLRRLPGITIWPRLAAAPHLHRLFRGVTTTLIIPVSRLVSAVINANLFIDGFEYLIPKNQEDYHFSVTDDDPDEDSDKDSIPHEIRDDWPTTDGDVNPKHQQLSEVSS